jgi:hypothetical protein
MNEALRFCVVCCSGLILLVIESDLYNMEEGGGRLEPLFLGLLLVLEFIFLEKKVEDKGYFCPYLMSH